MKINYWEDLEPNVIYHIYNRAVGKDNLFANQENYHFFLKKWKNYMPYADVFAFCLMPNHFHFLVKIRPLSAVLTTHVQAQNTVSSQQFLGAEIPYSTYLEDQFKRLFSSYALAFNKQQGRHGSLFQKHFKRISVSDEYKLHYLLTYIHHNPIHHRFCQDYQEWKFSSWMAYQNLDQPSLINRLEVLGWFHEDLKEAHTRFLIYHERFQIEKKMEDFTLEDN